MHYNSNFENIIENLHFNTPKFASGKQVKTHVTFIAHHVTFIAHHVTFKAHHVTFKGHSLLIFFKSSIVHGKNETQMMRH